MCNQAYTDEAGTFWDAIFEGKPFDYVDSVISALSLLKVEEVIAFGQRYLFNTNTRTTMSVMIFGSEYTDTYTTLTANTTGVFDCTQGLASTTNTTASTYAATNTDTVSHKSDTSSHFPTIVTITPSNFCSTLNGLTQLREANRFYEGGSEL